jgi:AraC-like DNA-binding protein
MKSILYGFPIQIFASLTLFPLFFLYVSSLVIQRKPGLKKVSIHFLFPAVMMVTYIIIQKFMMSKSEQVIFVTYLLDIHNNIPDRAIFSIGKSIYDIGKIGYVLVSLGYFVFSAMYLIRHYKRIKDFFPNNKQKELIWLGALMIFTCILVIFFTIIQIIDSRYLASNQYLVSASYLSFALFFWFLGLNGFRQTEIYPTKRSNETPVEDHPELSKETFIEFIEKHKPFRRTHISVFDFCIFFRVKRQELTDFIAAEFGMSFRELMNQLRIDDASEIIAIQISDNIEPDLNEISFKTGFDSPATFIKVFKNIKGKSPSEFIKEIKH